MYGWRCERLARHRVGSAFALIVMFMPVEWIGAVKSAAPSIPSTSRVALRL